MAAQSTPAFTMLQALVTANDFPPIVQRLLCSLLGYLQLPKATLENHSYTLCFRGPPSDTSALKDESGTCLWMGDDQVDPLKLLQAMVPNHWCRLNESCMVVMARDGRKYLRPSRLGPRIASWSQLGAKLIVADIRGWSVKAINHLLYLLQTQQPALDMHPVIITDDRQLPEGVSEGRLCLIPFDFTKAWRGHTHTVGELKEAEALALHCKDTFINAPVSPASQECQGYIAEQRELAGLAKSPQHVKFT